MILMSLLRLDIISVTVLVSQAVLAVSSVKLLSGGKTQDTQLGDSFKSCQTYVLWEHNAAWYCINHTKGSNTWPKCVQKKKKNTNKNAKSNPLPVSSILCGATSIFNQAIQQKLAS